MNRRLLFVIIIIVLVLGGVAGLVYFTYQKQQATQQEEATLQIIKVIDEAVIAPVSAYNNSSLWYFNKEGRLFKSNVDGSGLSEFPLARLPKGNILTALWPVNGADLITVTSYNNQTLKTYYNTKSNLAFELPSNVQWLEWLPDGKRVVYVWQSADKKTQQLVRANADGSGYKNIANLIYPDLILKAGNDGSTVLMYRSTIVGDINKIYAANLDTGVISTMVGLGKNTGAKWLPVGNKFLFTADSRVYLFDVLNKMTIDLKLSTTLDKIAIDAGGKNLYAAVAKSDNSGDYFVKVNLSSAIAQNYFEPSSPVKVKSVMLVGSTVYFVDNKDSKLYMISK